MPQVPTPHWFDNAVVYQIYPRSFADSNGDGVGDLAGIVQHLDYLQELGVDAIWLSPVYRSPMADFGYDVADEEDIDPLFGNLEDFDQLVAEAHSRNIKVLMDLVPNHTSNQHPWFVESRRSKDNPRRDWYIWKDPKADGSAPNNWQSVFGGSAWTLDEATGQYYLHSFLKEQPDLNWENPKVQRAMQDVMRFWYKRGCDGFRVDAILFTSKDLTFRDDPVRVGGANSVLQAELDTSFSHGVGAHLATYIKVLTDVDKEFPESFMYLEAYPDQGTPEGYAALYGYFDNNLAAAFNFGVLVASEHWQAQLLKDYIDRFQASLPSGARPAYVLGNHDMPRIASRIGAVQARAAAVMLLSLPGTKFIYYGEELGMHNVEVPLGQRVDPSQPSRDPERTPMQWSSEANAGFSKAKPWLPLAGDFRQVDAEAEASDPGSMLNLYRRLTHVAHRHEALAGGAYEPYDARHMSVFAFIRRSEGAAALVLINCSGSQVVVHDPRAVKVLLSSTGQELPDGVNQGDIRLAPLEAVIVELQG